MLVSRQISDDIKQYSYEICQRHSAIIRYMETDKDHIHYMIETCLLYTSKDPVAEGGLFYFEWTK